MIGVVEEENEVTEADQGVRPVTGLLEVLTVAMHVTHHVDSHACHPKTYGPAPVRCSACTAPRPPAVP
ncbi:hypothetical protein GCM10022420_073210 [Streptomyces iranensis]